MLTSGDRTNEEKESKLLTEGDCKKADIAKENIAVEASYRSNENSIRGLLIIHAGAITALMTALNSSKLEIWAIKAATLCNLIGLVCAVIGYLINGKVILKVLRGESVNKTVEDIKVCGVSIPVKKLHSCLIHVSLLAIFLAGVFILFA